MSERTLHTNKIVTAGDDVQYALCRVINQYAPRRYVQYLEMKDSHLPVSALKATSSCSIYICVCVISNKHHICLQQDVASFM